MQREICCLLVLSCVLVSCSNASPVSHPTKQFAADQLMVRVGESHAWYDRMPGAFTKNDHYPHISVGLRILSSQNITGLRVSDVEVWQNGTLIGTFTPALQVTEECGQEGAGDMVPTIELPPGCAMDVNVRSLQERGDAKDLYGTIKVRFKLENNEYFSAVIESPEMSIGFAV